MSCHNFLKLNFAEKIQPIYKLKFRNVCAQDLHRRSFDQMFRIDKHLTIPMPW